jgi:hypothetical protein
MIRYEIVVKPVQLPARLIVVDTINAVGIYLANEVIPSAMDHINRSLQMGDDCAYHGFDSTVRVRVVYEGYPPPAIVRAATTPAPLRSQA